MLQGEHLAALARRRRYDTAIAVGPVVPGGRCLTDLRHTQQGCFDFSRFDANAANLDLIVVAAEVVQHAVGILLHQVARPVVAAPVMTKRHESRIGQFGLIAISARNAGATDPEFAFLASAERGLPCSSATSMV